MVNLRSGTSFMRIDSKNDYERITGSPIGSHVFLGVLKLIGSYTDPTEAINAAKSGDSSNVDLSVGDIYGGAYSTLGLPS
jgi:pantothenate kinase